LLESRKEITESWLDIAGTLDAQGKPRWQTKYVISPGICRAY
jgi:hypothetical protein